MRLARLQLLTEMSEVAVDRGLSDNVLLPFSDAQRLRVTEIAGGGRARPTVDAWAGGGGAVARLLQVLRGLLTPYSFQTEHHCILHQTLKLACTLLLGSLFRATIC